MKRCLATLIVSAAAVGLLPAPSAQGAIVTIGSSLTGTYTPITAGSLATFTNTSLNDPSALVTSPVSGRIIRWRLTGATGGPFRLRVLTPNGGLVYTGAGTSEPQAPTGTATQAFATSLPISAGQTIGLDNTNGVDQIGLASAPVVRYAYAIPPAPDGPPSTFQAGLASEIGFNADVATVPSNEDKFGKLTRNTQNGTATLSVEVPGPGSLTLAGKGVKAQRTTRRAKASKAVTAAGIVKLLIKAKGKKKMKLNENGKVKVKVRVTYTPTGDLPGVPNTKTRSVKLIKND